MAKPRETFRKKELEDKKKKKQKEKAERKEARKSNAKSGSLEDMIAYVDEYGRITSTPPDPTKKAEISTEEIQIGVPKQLPPDPADLIHTGTVTFFNTSKGYGFIKDAATGESVFVHIHSINGTIAENDKVSFEIEKGPRGFNAVNVTKA
jgi:cold shock CspA family protein